MKITLEQKKKLEKIEREFSVELVKIKQEILKLMKIYDQKKTQLMQARVRKKMSTF